MRTDNKYRTLIWIIVILAATNLSTLGSFYYHRRTELKAEKKIQEEQTSIPGEQRTRFFREELNLNDSQLDEFRDINRTFNRTARGIEMNLAQLRENLIGELGSQNPDTVRLNELAREIGDYHRQLKEVTSTFYLKMRKICTTEQQEKLHSIFESMLDKDSRVNLPRNGNPWGRGRNR
jgi:Spy/CpxP family protein refolding chaperone